MTNANIKQPIAMSILGKISGIRNISVTKPILKSYKASQKPIQLIRKKTMIPARFEITLKKSFNLSGTRLANISTRIWPFSDHVYAKLKNTIEANVTSVISYTPISGNGVSLRNKTSTIVRAIIENTRIIAIQTATLIRLLQIFSS